MFSIREIVWAKVKGYPWWPAELSKLPNKDSSLFKVSFIGQNNHAHLQQKAVRKYEDNYENLKNNKYKGLQNSIELADLAHKKRKQSNPYSQIKLTSTQQNIEKPKKIKRKLKRKLNGKIVKKTKIIQKIQKKQKEIQSQEIENSIEIVQNESENQQKQSLHEQSADQQLDLSEVQFSRNVNRKKIEETEQKLLAFIHQLNQNKFDTEKQCYQLILTIEREQFKAEQLVQSKITNMITYIHKVLSEKPCQNLKKQQIDRIGPICNKLKQTVLTHLFDGSYYDFFLKKMSKTTSQERVVRNEITPAKKVRKYRRKVKKFKNK